MDNERTVLAEAMGEVGAHVMKELRAECDRKLAQRDREIANLQAENRELKSMLGDVLARLGQTDDKLKDLRDDLKGAGALKVRLARLEGLFAGKMNQLASFADAAGTLPRGWKD